MGFWDVLTMPKYQSGLSFRDTELFNLAMLAKQTRRLIEDPASLSAWILRSVYYAHGDVLQAELGNHPSQVWRAVCAGVIVLKQGPIKRVGYISFGRTIGSHEISC